MPFKSSNSFILSVLFVLIACNSDKAPERSFQLAIEKTGQGSGSVVSTPLGIDCGGDCSFTYDQGSVIQLVAIADNDSQFLGWSGACSGTGICEVSLSQQSEVVAEFIIHQKLKAFPGAEGFGTFTTGGRGGDVVYVTNLNASGPGSLNEALGYKNAEMDKPRYILFKVSGVVDSKPHGSPEWHNMTHVQYGNFTYAGHSSPGGVIVQGLTDSCENGVDCVHNNMIFRHLKSRPDGTGQDDALRLNGSRNVIIDHASLARASDEVMQIAENSNYTIQNSILAETVGGHYDRGGVLIKYSTPEKPNTDISFHHNMFHRIGGRLPQIDCADHPNDMCEAPYEMNLEFSYNLIWDPASYQYVKSHYLNPWGQQFGLKYNINFINNYMYVRDDYGKPMFASTNREHDAIYYSGNKMNLYSEYQDLELMYCCSSFSQELPNTHDHSKGKIASAHDFPELTATGSDEAIIDYMINYAGAFPRDVMDRRFIQSLIDRSIDETHWSEKPADDAHLFDWHTPPPPVLDSDDDGMPDDWEICNGLDPLVQDHNQKQLSSDYTGVEGYDNLEVYLNRLSDHLVHNVPLSLSPCAEQDFELDVELSQSELTLSELSLNELVLNEERQVTITISADSKLSEVLINTDQVIAPSAWPSPDAIDITASGINNQFSYKITIPENSVPGSYQVSIKASSEDGEVSYAIAELNLR